MTQAAVHATVGWAGFAGRAERCPKVFLDVRTPEEPGHRIAQVVASPTGIHVAVRPANGGSAGNLTAAIDASVSSAEAVGRLLPDRYRVHVRAVVLEDHDGAAGGDDRVIVATAETLSHIVRASPVVLSTSELNEIVSRLESRLETLLVENAASRRGLSWGARLLAGSVGTSACVAASVLALELAELLLLS